MRQAVGVNTDPPDAEVYYDGIPVDSVAQKGKGAEMLRGVDGHKLLVQKEGYRSRLCTLERKLDAALIIFNLPLIGHLVDGSTGSWYNQKPETLKVLLEKKTDGQKGYEPVPFSQDIATVQRSGSEIGAFRKKGYSRFLGKVGNDPLFFWKRGEAKGVLSRVGREELAPEKEWNVEFSNELEKGWIHRAGDEVWAFSSSWKEEQETSDLIMDRFRVGKKKVEYLGSEKIGTFPAIDDPENSTDQWTQSLGGEMLAFMGGENSSDKKRTELFFWRGDLENGKAGEGKKVLLPFSRSKMKNESFKVNPDGRIWLSFDLFGLPTKDSMGTKWEGTLNLSDHFEGKEMAGDTLSMFLIVPKDQEKAILKPAITPEQFSKMNGVDFPSEREEHLTKSMDERVWTGKKSVFGLDHQGRPVISGIFLDTLRPWGLSGTFYFRFDREGELQRTRLDSISKNVVYSEFSKDERAQRIEQCVEGDSTYSPRIAHARPFSNGGWLLVLEDRWRAVEDPFGLIYRRAYSPTGAPSTSANGTPRPVSHPSPAISHAYGVEGMGAMAGGVNRSEESVELKDHILLKFNKEGNLEWEKRMKRIHPTNTILGDGDLEKNCHGFHPLPNGPSDSLFFLYNTVNATLKERIINYRTRLLSVASDGTIERQNLLTNKEEDELAKTAKIHDNEGFRVTTAPGWQYLPAAPFGRDRFLLQGYNGSACRFFQLNIKGTESE